jgi:hypothetical protein
MMCVGFMFLGVYPLSAPTTQRTQQPYLAWSIVSTEMIVVYASGWVSYILLYLVEGSGIRIHLIFMLALNIV